MSEPTRRAFLAAAGASALAGCPTVELPGGRGVPGRADDERGVTPGARETSSSAGDAPVQYGTVVDDFEALDHWGPVDGKGSVEAAAETVYAGRQSAHVRAPRGAAVGGLARQFPDGLDLSGHDLSAAVKLERPEWGQIREVTAVALAPGADDRVEFTRYVPDDLDEWTRLDFGVTDDAGDPQLDRVSELRIEVRTGGGAPVEFWIDDLRAVPKPDGGYAVLQFDDTLASHYETVLPIMQERGYAGVEAVVPSAVGTDGHLTLDQLRELDAAGWDLVSEPRQPRPLPAYSKERQRQFVTAARDYLADQGFTEGAEHAVVPYNQLSGETVAVLAEAHETAFAYGGCPTPTAATGQYVLSRVDGDSRGRLRQLAPLASEYDQTLAVYFPEVRAGGDMDEAAFRDALGVVEDAGLEPITVTEFYRKMRALRSG